MRLFTLYKLLPCSALMFFGALACGSADGEPGGSTAADPSPGADAESSGPDGDVVFAEPVEQTPGASALQTGHFTVCGKESVRVDVGPPEILGTVEQRIEGYYFDQLTADLEASPELQSKSGLTEVGNCVDARTLVNAQLELAGEISGVDLGEVASDEPLVDKIGGSAFASGQKEVLFLSFEGMGSCTGTAINRNYIITAAHCFGGATSGRVTAWNHTLNNDRPPGPGFWTMRTRIGEIIETPPGSSAATFMVPAGYSGSGDFHDDIGIIRLHAGLEMDSNDHYAILWREATSKLANGVTVSMAGWARENNVVDAMYTGFTLPDRWSSDFRYIRSKYDSGSNNNRARFCQGDSGGPLIHNLFGSRRVVAGVASYWTGVETLPSGKICTKEDASNLWTAVYPHRSWIINNVPGCDLVTNDKGWRYYDCR